MIKNLKGAILAYSLLTAEFRVREAKRTEITKGWEKEIRDVIGESLIGFCITLLLNRKANLKKSKITVEHIYVFGCAQRVYKRCNQVCVKIA